MHKYYICTILALLIAGCSTSPIDKREAASPRLDRIFDKTYLKTTTDCRPVHLTRDGGLVLSGIELIVSSNETYLVALKSGESLEICMPPGVYKLTAVPAMALSRPVINAASPRNFLILEDPTARGEVEIDTRPDMRYNVRIKSMITPVSQRTTLEYTGERMVR